MDRRPKSVRYMQSPKVRQQTTASNRVLASAMNFEDYKKPPSRGFTISRNRRDNNDGSIKLNKKSSGSIHTSNFSSSIRSRFSGDSIRSHKPLSGSKSFHRK